MRKVIKKGRKTLLSKTKTTSSIFKKKALLYDMLSENIRLTGSPEEKILASNQVECKRCGDNIFSASVHDYKTCKCGAVTVDGGQHYVHTSWLDGEMTKHLIEKHIWIKRADMQALIDAVNWGIKNHRNQYGIALAVLRACRDTGLLKGF